MERTLILQTTQGETVTETEVCCFARQLLKDLKSDHPKFKWERDENAPWGAFVSTGLHGTSLITLSTYRQLKQPITFMSYYKDGNLVYTVQEFDGNPANPKHLAHLYKWVSASVKHQNIYGDSDVQRTDPHLSVDKMNDWCLKVNELFRTVTADEIVTRLMNCPSLATLNVSEGSPEFQRRTQQVRNLVQMIQYTRTRESSLILDGFALKKADGTLCGHITTDPIAKWANAHVIVRKNRYAGLAFDEIRVKVASDIIANLLMIL